MQQENNSRIQPMLFLTFICSTFRTFFLGMQNFVKQSQTLKCTEKNSSKIESRRPQSFYAKEKQIKLKQEIKIKRYYYWLSMCEFLSY